MTMPDDIRSELARLFWSLCDGSFSPADVGRVERLAKDYTEVRAMYAQFMVMCGLLRWEHRPSPAVAPSAGEERYCADGRSPLSGAASRRGLVRRPPTQPQPFQFFAVHASALSYAAVAVIAGVGVLAAGLWQSGMERALPFSAGPRAAAVRGTSAAPCVARITKLTDCRRDLNSAAADGPFFRVGQGFVLPHGVVEITYQSGAVVTIKAPAKFVVTSRTSGGLICGTAIVRVSRGEAVAGQAPIENDPEHEKYQEYWILPPAGGGAIGAARMPSFSIATPATGFLAGDGDEFQVSVDESWGSVTKVLHGAVVMLMPTYGREQSTLLGEGHYAMITMESRGNCKCWTLHSWDTAPFVAQGSMPNAPWVVFDRRRNSGKGKSPAVRGEAVIERFLGS